MGCHITFMFVRGDPHFILWWYMSQEMYPITRQTDLPRESPRNIVFLQSCKSLRNKTWRHFIKGCKPIQGHSKQWLQGVFTQFEFRERRKEISQTKIFSSFWFLDNDSLTLTPYKKQLSHLLAETNIILNLSPWSAQLSHPWIIFISRLQKTRKTLQVRSHWRL